ncbi:MAG TPA: SAM-dependent methyltransferase [Streptosporangiaceae bacterium]|nr:SAM-dependent methyltransferase [Streptosporangiaceae bacterium]
MAVPPVPLLDAGRIARLRDVLAGGHMGLAPDRQLARSILERWPGTASLVKSANDFNSRTAVWAVSGGTPEWPVPPAEGVIFAASGYPVGVKTDRESFRALPGGGFHPGAAEQAPRALFVYADADPGAVLMSKVLLSEPEPLRVSACQVPASDPAALLSTPAARVLLDRGPVMVQLQLCAMWWPPELAAWAVAEYGRLLPPGSTVALSLIVPGGASDSHEFLAAFGGAGGIVYPHTEADIAGWITAADLDLVPPGVTDVRGRELGWAAAKFGRQQTTARTVGAVAVVR